MKKHWVYLKGLDGGGNTQYVVHYQPTHCNTSQLMSLSISSLSRSHVTLNVASTCGVLITMSSVHTSTRARVRQTMLRRAPDCSDPNEWVYLRTSYRLSNTVQKDIGDLLTASLRLDLRGLRLTPKDPNPIASRSKKGPELC